MITLLWFSLRAPEEHQNNDIEMVSDSWGRLPAVAQVPLPSADVLHGWAAPKVTVTLSSAVCPVVCPVSERMFLLRSSSRTAMCVVPRFILNKNKFPLT